MENVQVIKPQPRTLDSVHGGYAELSEDQKRNKAHEKLQGFIDAGAARAKVAVARILGEVPVDRIVRSQTIEFAGDHDELAIQPGGQEFFPIHHHALGQVAQRFGFPTKYMNELRGSDWGRVLVAKNLNELADHQGQNDKLLVRQVGRQIRGVMSNGYRTDDSRPALDALIGVAHEVGAVIADADALDTKTSVKIMVAKPIELFKGEWAVFGLDYKNSDYGDGAREICGWILRLLCLNGAVTSANFRRVHLGSRIQDEVEYSNRTRKLNADFTASATRDMARALLGPVAIEKLVDQVRAANATALDADAAIASIRKQVNKDEEKQIVEKYNSPDVELLPPGNTKWRFSNAISWLAGQQDDAGRKLELERVAGAVLEVAAA
jgi:hypothetical protein